MIKHIVMWKFKESAEGKSRAENMQIVKEQLLSLVDREGAIAFAGRSDSPDSQYGGGL